jgi:hypothetical protein
MSMEIRLRDAGRSLRESFDPMPPPLRPSRRRVAPSRVAFAAVLVVLACGAAVLLAAARGDTPSTPTVDVPMAVPDPPATVPNYVGFLANGDWVQRQRSLGVRVEFWSPTGTIPSPGRVVEQDPPSGAPTDESTVVRLRVDVASIDLPGEIAVGLAGVHPAWGYWRVSVTPPVDPATAPPENPSLATVFLQREIGSGNAVTVDRQSVIGPRATTPLPGAQHPLLPMFVTDLGQPNTLSFGLAPAATAAVVLADAMGMEVGRAQLSGVELNGDRFVVWASDAPVPSGTRFRAVGPTGEVLAEAGVR